MEVKYTDTNIAEVWEEKKRDMQEAWKSEIADLLLPEIGKRGFALNSTTSEPRADGYSALWMFYIDEENVYLEVRADAKRAFSAKIISPAGASVWPGVPMSTYDRKNYTVQLLLDWLDTEPWKV